MASRPMAVAGVEAAVVGVRWMVMGGEGKGVGGEEEEEERGKVGRGEGELEEAEEEAEGGGVFVAGWYLSKGTLLRLGKLVWVVKRRLGGIGEGRRGGAWK